MWVKCNPNPLGKAANDCVVRAIAVATERSWQDVYADLCRMGRIMCDMPSSNAVWGMFLEKEGHEQFLLPESCPRCVTVRAFAERFPRGTYIIGTGNHAVAVIDGDYYDSWDSGDEIPSYFWKIYYGGMEMAYPYQNTWNPMSYQPQQTMGLIWVDGEQAAKSYQLPAGWPANTPLALWDSNETTIYLKSVNGMGMPNPLQIAHYELIERTGFNGMSSAGEERGKAWDEEMKALYASKEELLKLREEIEKLKEEKK